MERVDDAGDGSDEHLHVQPPAESNEYAAKSMVCTAFTTVNHGPAVLYQRTVETLFLQSESASTDTKALSGLAVAVFKYALPSNRHTDSSMLCRWIPFVQRLVFFEHAMPVRALWSHGAHRRCHLTRPPPCSHRALPLTRKRGRSWYRSYVPAYHGLLTYHGARPSAKHNRPVGRRARSSVLEYVPRHGTGPV
jgi:hypothetical protein